MVEDQSTPNLKESDERRRAGGRAEEQVEEGGGGRRREEEPAVDRERNEEPGEEAHPQGGQQAGNQFTLNQQTWEADKVDPISPLTSEGEDGKGEERGGWKAQESAPPEAQAQDSKPSLPSQIGSLLERLGTLFLGPR